MAFDIEFSTKRARLEIRALNNRIDQLGRAADGASAKLQGSLGSLGGANQLRNIQSAINSVNQNLTRMGNNWQKAQTQAAKSSTALNKKVVVQHQTVKRAKVGADQYGDSLLTLSQKAAILRSGMLALGTHVGIFSATTLLAATATFGLVKALKAVVTVGAQFTRSLAATSAIVGVSKENLGVLTEEMLRLAETTKFTTTEVAEASTILAKTGLKAVEVAQSLPAVLDLAAIGAMEMSRAADIAANAMFGFQLKTSDLSEVVDTLAFAATNSNTTVQQLGNALSFAAPVAAAANAKFNEVAGMLAVMADSGVKASRAGTTLRRAYVNLLDPGEKAANVFSDLGVAIRDDVTGQMRSMVEIMRDFTIAGGSAVDITRIFGVRAAPGMIAVWKDMAKAVAGGDSKLKDFLKRLRTEGIGSSNRMREAMEDNLIDTWLKFKSVLSVEATRAFELVEEGLINLVKTMTNFVRTSVDVQDTVAALAIHLKQWSDLFTDLPKDISAVRTAMELLGVTVDDHNKAFVKNMQFVGQALKDLPINIAFGLRAGGAILANTFIQMEISVKKFWTKMKRMVVSFKGASMVAWREIGTGFFAVFDPIFDWMAKKLLDAADLMRNIPGTGALVTKLSQFSQLLSEAQGSTIAAQALADEVSARDQAVATLDREIQRLTELSGLQEVAHTQQIDRLLDERKARLDTRDAALKQLGVQKMLAAQAQRMAAERQGFVIPGPEVEVPPGRRPLQEPDTDLLGETVKDFKQFVKLQKASVDSTNMQIQRLKVLKEISPFEAFRASIEKQQQSLDKITVRYHDLLAPLEEFKQKAEDGKYLSVAREYQEQIDKLKVSYETQAVTAEKAIAQQTNALTLLEQKYKLTTTAAGEYRIELERMGAMSETELFGKLDEIREEGMSPAQKSRREFEEKMTVLNEARITEQTMFAEHKEMLLLSEQEYQDRSLQLQIQAAAQQAQLWGGHHTHLFNLAEAVRQRDLQGMMQYGIAALDQAGKTSKKAFDLSKKAKIAQAIMATFAGMAEALKWGFPMGPIFAALIGAAGAIQIQAIKNTKFGGGSSASPKSSGGSVSVPSAAVPNTPIPSQSDVLFKQTDTGGVNNTVDSSSFPQNVNLKFEFSAVDAKGIDSLIRQKAPQIVSVVQAAYTESGKSGGPLT